MFEAIGIVFDEVGSWFVTNQEQQEFDLTGQAYDTQVLISNNELAIAGMEETFSEGEQQQLIFYAVIAIIIIILIIIGFILVKK